MKGDDLKKDLEDLFKDFKPPKDGDILKDLIPVKRLL